MVQKDKNPYHRSIWIDKAHISNLTTMKKSLELLFILCLFTLQVAAQQEIKVISYNILEGLGNEASYGKGRHDRCVQWLKEQHADVIALQELYGSEEKLSQDAKQWGHLYYAKAGPIGLTSKKPIEFVKKYKKGLWHGVLHCKTYGIDILVIHLSPADWKYRFREASLIKEIVDSVKQTTREYIVMGDFNAHSPFDSELYKQNPELVKKYQKGDKHQKSKGSPYRSLIDGHIDYSVISEFLSFPLIDVTERFVPWYRRHTFPTPILIGVWRTAGNIGRTPERIDYILTSIEMSKKCKGVKVHNGEECDYLSDHYPLEAIFAIDY